MQTLKALRTSKEMSPEDVASFIDKSRKTVEGYENGIAHTMSFRTAIKLAELYDVTIEQLAEIVFPSKESE